MKKNNYKIEQCKCKICGYETNNHQSFNSHITHAHKINSKEYYDLYIKTKKDGVCKTCGKTTAFLNMWKGYRVFCSDSCMSSNKDIQQKRKQTSMIHYGVEFPHQSQVVKDNMAKTCLKKYGSTNLYSSEYGKQKIAETNLKRYGAINPWLRESSIVNKSMQTFFARTGFSHPAKSRDVRLKAIKTSMKNGNRSSYEDLLEQFFKDNHIKYEHEYKDVRYPYYCDFYLPDTDTFIEIHGFWMHGGHWFNKKDPKDIQVLNNWKSKAQEPNSQYYTAINSWIKIDLLKKQIAKKNKLNYIVLWNKKDIYNFINTYKDMVHSH